MFIRETRTKYKDKVYVNHLLVESYRITVGPRQRVLCSLGDLSDRPEREWHQLVHKIENALNHQMPLFPLENDPDGDFVEGIVKRIEECERESPGCNGCNNNSNSNPITMNMNSQAGASDCEAGGNNNIDGNYSSGVGVGGDVIGIHTDKVRTEEPREGGSVHVGVQYWQKLCLDQILRNLGFSERLESLTCAMVMNRLIHPKSEHAMPDWIRSTALDDILGEDFSTLCEDRLYRNLDRLHPLRSQIESELARQERNLFNLDHTVYLYDLTSTYFEGNALSNGKARRGYSRDKRPDCSQVVIGLVINRDGFPLCHEVFEGNIKDSQTVGRMLDLLDKRVGLKAGGTVVVDRGMSYAGNLEELRRRKLNYIVASRQSERDQWLADFDNYSCGEYEEVVRAPSPQNPYQKKGRVRIKMRRSGGGDTDTDTDTDNDTDNDTDTDNYNDKDKETYILCISDARREKDRAIREKQEKKLLNDLNKLKRRITNGKLKRDNKISEALGRLRERYPRVVRYYKMVYDRENKDLCVSVDLEKMEKARSLDGAYLLKTSRSDLTAEEVWRTYMLLTRAESAFRSMKSPLSERPIFHHLEHRVDTHIFLCVLAYHLLVAIEKTLLDKGRHTSWETVRETLATHQVSTVVLPTTNGAELRIRQDSVAEPRHKELYKLLEVPHKIMKPIKTWREKRRGSD